MSKEQNSDNPQSQQLNIAGVSRCPSINFFNVDCIEFMKSKPDKCYDLAIVDPPYGINRSKNFGAKEFGWTQHKRSEWDNTIPTAEYFKELFRVSKNQIIWGGNYMVEHLKPSMGWIFWDKKITNANNTNFSDGELAWTSFNCILRRFTYDWIGFGYLNNKTGQKKIHPTEKPTQIYGEVLKHYTKQGFKLLDTHFGSGSIALAVDKANRLDKMNLHLTACEIDKEYIDKAIKRISESIKQGTLSF